ncbi:MBL fold metallo-hydrolase [Paraglaciecola sp. 2405UD69-4]|uniref:MBL fold metallo-hydrolase n=1 Tax=Paraglaciecola sp. 2405UD69-4 TaxID=3391836 RepID=UPI0039C986E2
MMKKNHFLRYFLLYFSLLHIAGTSAKEAAIGDSPIEMTYLGSAGWIIKDGDITVLLDPYVSRLQLKGRELDGDDRKVYSVNEVGPTNTAQVDKLITDADYILVHHSHHDHLGDVPYIAKKTGAKVIGTETTKSILMSYGVPEEQLYVVVGGEDYQFDNFSVRVLPSIHSALNNKLYHDSRRYDSNSNLKAPLTIGQFVEGGSLMFLARFKNKTVLTMGSMNFLQREIADLKPDILLAGVNGSRLNIYNYDERLIKLTGKPPIVIPTHWDSFSWPYDVSQKVNVDKKLKPFKENVLKVAPNTDVIFPTHLKTITIN